MNGWEVIFLGIMAASLLAMAVAQMVMAREAAKMARQASDTLQEFRRELKPVMDKLHVITDDVGKAAALARQQVERVDEVVSATAQRIEETVAVVQDAIAQPIRQGAAILAGLRAALTIFRAPGDSARPASRDEEDALFIG